MVGISSPSSSSALEAPWTDRISIQCPSSITSTSVASSHQNASAGKPSATARLKPQAVVIASAISVIIAGRRSASSEATPRRNGQPP